ncbi:MAG: pilus assembly protein TadG-related protein, partial [Terriglobia bacterium]
MSENLRSRRRGTRGFVLITMAIAAVVVFACLGLAVDVGRAYIAKNEAQAYADAAALTAALEMDGTSAGITAAQAAAAGVKDKWDFGTKSFTGATVEVAPSSAGPWISADSPPSPASDYIYVRVTAQAPISLYFTPIFKGVTNSLTVRAAAVAAQLPLSTLNEGAFPFSPIAFDGPTGGDNTTAPWGFVPGSQYTMRYASNGKSECAG